MARRRSNNEGSITQRPNRSWRAQTMLEGKRLSHSAKTRRECQIWLKQTIGQIDKVLSFSGVTIQLKAYIEGWLNTIKENRCSKTYVQYQIIVNRYILPAFGDYRLKDLRPQLIETYLTDQQVGGIGVRTC